MAPSPIPHLRDDVPRVRYLEGKPLPSTLQEEGVFSAEIEISAQFPLVWFTWDGNGTTVKFIWDAIFG